MVNGRQMCKEGFQKVANIVVKHLWLIGASLCVAFLVTGPSFAVLYISHLPESFHFEKLYLAVILAYLVISLVVSILLVIYAKKLEKKQKAKPSQQYLGMRMKAVRYAMELEESGRTFKEELNFYTKKSLVCRLDGNDEDEQQNKRQVKHMLEKFYEKILNGNVDRKQMAIRAITFTIKSQLIKHPSDLQGRRRAHFLIKLLSEITNDSTCCHLLKSRLSSCWDFCLQRFKELCSFISSTSCWDFCLQRFKELCFYVSSFFPSSSQTKYSWMAIVLTAATTLFLTIIPYVVDIYTDANLVSIYWDLWSSSPKSLYFLITGSSANDFPHSELIIPTVYLFIFLAVSMILLVFSNLPKKLARCYKVQMKMKNPEVEKSGEILSPSSVIQRHDVAVHESSFESPYQSIWQFGIYLSIIPLLHAVPADIFNLEELANYDHSLKFMPDFLLSGLATLWSLTRGQVQKNNIFEEHNLTWKQSIVYHLASLASTVVFLLLVTSTVSSWLGFSYNAPTSNTVNFLICFTIIILSVGTLATRFIRSIQHATHFSLSALLRPFKQTITDSTKPKVRISPSGSLASTVVLLLVLTSTVSSWLGFSYNAPTFNTVIYLIFFTLVILSVGPLVTRIIRSIQHATHFSLSALCRAFRQTFTGSTKLTNRLPAPPVSWVFSTFTALHLPTSQHISNGCYSFYHTTITQSPQLLFQMAAQCLAYSCFLSWLLLFSSLDFHDNWSRMHLNSKYTVNDTNIADITNIYNMTIVDMARYERTNVTFVRPASDLSNAVKSAMISTLGGIPVGFIVSYLSLYLYFYLDNGFYSNVNMDYWFHNGNEIDTDNNDEDVENADEIDGDDSDEDVENTGGNIELVVDSNHGSSDGSEEDSIKVEGWLQKWIDQDVEEDFCSWRKFKACNKRPKPFKEWNMQGTWIDLTGDDGMVGDCEDGAAVLSSREGIGFDILMSFPYFRCQREEEEVEDAETVSTTSSTAREEVSRNRNTPVDAERVSDSSSTYSEDVQEHEVELGSSTLNTMNREAPEDAGTVSTTSSTDQEDGQKVPDDTGTFSETSLSDQEDAEEPEIQTTRL